jgi:hypothetical protein
MTADTLPSLHTSLPYLAFAALLSAALVLTPDWAAAHDWPPAQSADSPSARNTAPSIGTWIERGPDVLRDSATGLEWTQSDNGEDIDWKAAQSFCAGKQAGWRLPAVEELENVYRIAASRSESASCRHHACSVPGLFKLSGAWFWSATRAGREKDDGRQLFWGVLMVNGARTPNLADFDYGSRALCVRTSKAAL